ncbi:MAG: ROK family transcriptional regulator [Microbacteriaceae bacterium]
MPGLDQTAVRRVNTSVVLRALAGHDDEATLQTLAAHTALSRRTVELILAELVAEGWAREAASRSGVAGRPARRFRFVAERSLVAGARIDTHLAHGVVADLHGRVLGRAERVLGDDYFAPERAVAHAAAAVRAAADDAGVPIERLGAGGIAAGGVIDPDAGVVRRLVNAPCWSGFGLGTALSAEFGIPWVADNDANLAALAEFRDGAARGRRHIAWLIHGQRSGAGFIVGGELHRGAGGAAGELIESRVLGLERDPEHLIGRLSSPLATDRERGMAAVRAALDGDPAACAAARELAVEIADVIDVIAWTIAPELVVLGGGLEAGAELLVPLVRERLSELGAPDVEFAASTVGADAPILGAVRLALDRIDAELYGPIVV